MPGYLQSEFERLLAPKVYRGPHRAALLGRLRDMRRIPGLSVDETDALAEAIKLIEALA